MLLSAVESVGVFSVCLSSLFLSLRGGDSQCRDIVSVPLLSCLGFASSESLSARVGVTFAIDTGLPFPPCFLKI